MLGNASPTPFDLRFSLLGIPVRVHPLFWLVSALGAGSMRDLNMVLLWIVCVFVSILVHELGHALAARSFGWHPEIVLYLFGGYASYLSSWGRTTARAITVLLAGPGAGFALFGAIWCLQWLVIHFRLIPDSDQARHYLGEFFFQMKFINLWWGLFNLMPVYPLDGGQICRELLTHFRRHDGLEISLKLSIMVGAALAVYLFTIQQTFVALLVGSLALESYQQLQRARYR